MMKIILSVLLLASVCSARYVKDSKTDYENSVCECVPYYQCNIDGMMNDDGEGIIDIRNGFVGTVDNPTSSRRQCDHYLSVCCLNAELLPGNDVSPADPSTDGDDETPINPPTTGGHGNGKPSAPSADVSANGKAAQTPSAGQDNEKPSEPSTGESGNGKPDCPTPDGGHGNDKPANPAAGDAGQANDSTGNPTTDGEDEQTPKNPSSAGPDSDKPVNPASGKHETENPDNPPTGGHGSDEPAKPAQGGNANGQPNMKPHERKGCGWRNANGIGFRITGNFNNEANFGEFPWMVAVLKQNNLAANVIQTYQCGGSIIHEKVILTAAHCVYGKAASELIIRAGEWDTQTVSEALPHQDRAVATVITHPRYNYKNLHNDFALLILEKPVELADNVEIVCLPEKDEYFDSSKCFATGWGKTEFGDKGKYQVILKAVELPTVAHDKCQSSLRTTRLGKYFKLDPSFMCAGGVDGVDTCTGDGGSPLVCPLPNDATRYTQAGIVAWGIGCGKNGIPGVYADVTKARQWIDQQLAAHNIDNSSYTPISKQNYPSGNELAQQPAKQKSSPDSALPQQSPSQGSNEKPGHGSQLPPSQGSKLPQQPPNNGSKSHDKKQAAHSWKLPSFGIGLDINLEF